MRLVLRLFILSITALFCIPHFSCTADTKTYVGGVRADIAHGPVFIGGATSGSSFQNQLIPGALSAFVSRYDIFGGFSINFLEGASGANSISAFNSLWTKNVPNPEYGALLTAVGATNTGVDGNSQIGTVDAFVVQYFPTLNWRYNTTPLNKAWTRQIGSPGHSVYANAVVVDSAYNVYVIGDTDGSIDGNPMIGVRDMFMVKYDIYGNKIWTKHYGYGASKYEINGAAIDSNDNIYIVCTTDSSGVFGMFNSSPTGPLNYGVAKFNSSGTFIWGSIRGVSTPLFGSPRSTQGLTITIGGVNNDKIFVAGSTNGAIEDSPQLTTGLPDLYSFYSAYDFSGNRLYTKRFGSVGTSPRISYPTGIIAEAGTNNVYVSGYTSGNVNVPLGQLGNSTGITDSYFVKFDGSNGSSIFKQQTGQAGKVSEWDGIASFGNTLYLGGATNGSYLPNTPVSMQDLLLGNYTPAGAQNWLVQTGSY